MLSNPAGSSSYQRLLIIKLIPWIVLLQVKTRLLSGSFAYLCLLCYHNLNQEYGPSSFTEASRSLVQCWNIVSSIDVTRPQLVPEYVIQCCSSSSSHADGVQFHLKPNDSSLVCPTVQRRWNQQRRHLEAILGHVPHAKRDEDGFPLECGVAKPICVGCRWDCSDFQHACMTSELILTSDVLASVTQHYWSHRITFVMCRRSSCGQFAHVSV